MYLLMTSETKFYLQGKQLGQNVKSTTFICVQIPNTWLNTNFNVQKSRSLVKVKDKSSKKKENKKSVTRANEYFDQDLNADITCLLTLCLLNKFSHFKI